MGWVCVTVTLVAFPQQMPFMVNVAAVQSKLVMQIELNRRPPHHSVGSSIYSSRIF